eukprot:Nk52_evm15s168 gene=Nk52_evmTU15s168
MHKSTFARKLTELYISYKDTKLSNDRKSRVAIEEEMLKSVKDGEEASTVDLGDWTAASASWVKNVTKTVNVCGKNVTETVKHAYTCYDMAELKFWPLCSYICHVNVEVGELSKGETLQNRLYFISKEEKKTLEDLCKSFEKDVKTQKKSYNSKVANGSGALSGAFSGGAEQPEIATVRTRSGRVVNRPSILSTH